MELSLKLLTGSSAGKEIKIPTKKFLIGRADDCNLRPHSDLVSRHHCALLVEEGFCAIRDFGSRNGTLVNGQRVVGQHELRNGDKLVVGNLEFEVQMTSSVGGKKRPKVKDVKDAAQRTAAGGPHPQDDDDISDWLTAEEAAGDTHRVDLQETRQPPHETPTLSAPTRDTTFLKAVEETKTLNPAPKVDPTKAAPDQPEDPAADRGAESAKKLFGAKLVASAKSAPKDSQAAAADALKRLFNSRKP